MGSQSRNTFDDDEHSIDDESAEDTRGQELSDDEIADDELDDDDFFSNDDDEFVEGSEFADEDEDTAVDDDDEGKDDEGDQKKTDTADDDDADDKDGKKDKAKKDEDLDAEKASLLDRYKNVQGFSTKVSQENVSLRAEIAALKEELGSEGVPSFNQSEYERILDEEGQAKAFEYRDASKEKEITAKLSRDNRRKEIQAAQERREAETEKFLDDNKVTDEEFSEMVNYKKQHQEMGFELSPAALLVLQQTGSFENAMELIKKGKAAGKQNKDDDDIVKGKGKKKSKPPKRRRAAPVPRGSGRSSSGKKSAPFAGSISVSDL